MGKLRKLRRQIERDPESWMWKSEWLRKYEPSRPYEVRCALGGRRGKFVPGWTGLGGWSRKRNGPYQQFVYRVLKDLGYNV